MSSEMPNDSTRSRKRDNASTDHASSTFADGRPLQMLFTPNAAQARRIASEWPCCVPTFIFTFGDVVGATMPDVAGACACCADTTASASAATGIPAPASLTNSRRFMDASHPTVFSCTWLARTRTHHKGHQGHKGKPFRSDL